MRYGKSGAGSGKKGCIVYGVEPNDDMRERGKSELAAYDRFISVNATAEHTALTAGSVDWVTAGQAFHWFDAPAFKKECQRILKIPNRIVLVWNVRMDNTPQVQETVQLLSRFCPEFKGFGGGLAHIQERISRFFDDACEVRRFRYDLLYDKSQFIARILSGSYCLAEEDRQYGFFIAALQTLFDKYAADGLITVPNETVAYYAKDLCASR